MCASKQVYACVRVLVRVVFVYILFVVLFAQFATFSSHSSTKCALGFNIAFCLLLICLIVCSLLILRCCCICGHTDNSTHTISGTCMRSHTHTRTHSRPHRSQICTRRYVYVFKRSAVCNFEFPPLHLFLFFFCFLAEVVYSSI